MREEGERRISRRTALRAGLAAGVSLALGQLPVAGARPVLLEKAIPSTGELLPVVGLGTARRYDVGDSAAERAGVRAALEKFVELGGRVIDTAPAYGRAEQVIGDLVRELGVRDRVFLATKVALRFGTGRDEGVRQLEQSLARLQTDRIDLVQVQNMSGVQDLLPLLRDWKLQGRIRYVGVTSTSVRQYEVLMRTMQREPLDFIQVDYAIDAREAAERVLPLAQSRRIAVLVNLPFRRGTLLEKLAGRPLPAWAGETGAATWPQFLLKHIVGHPAVTAVIPGMAATGHVADNLAAAEGRLPDAALRLRMERFVLENPAR